MKQGDVVIIIDSPYSDVPNGTRGTIRRVYQNHWGKNKPLYELHNMSTGDHRLFRSHELTPYPQERTP